MGDILRPVSNGKLLIYFISSKEMERKNKKKFKPQDIRWHFEEVWKFCLHCDMADSVIKTLNFFQTSIFLEKTSNPQLVLQISIITI